MARDKQLVEDNSRGDGVPASSGQVGSASYGGQLVAPLVPLVPEPYKLDFGMYKKHTIADMCNSEEEQKNSYIAWLFANKGKGTTSWYLDKLEHALRSEGWWETIRAQCLALRPVLHEKWQADKMAMGLSIVQGNKLHKDKVKLTNLRVAKVAQDRADDLHEEVGSSVATTAPKAPRRQHRSKAILENAHCSYCGVRGHKVPRCGQLRRDREEQALGFFSAPRCTDFVGLEKQIAQVTAHMKYTWPEQRCEYYDGKVKRVRQQQTICGHDIVRMNALEMAKYGIACGELDDLAGTTCDNPKCREMHTQHPKTAKASFSNPLGPLTGREDTFDVLRRTVGYRCEWCRRQYTVYHGNPSFGKKDKVEEAVWCHWMCVQGAPLTLSALHLNKSEDLVRRHYYTAQIIMAYDVEYKQAHMRFGGSKVHTTVFEVDGTRVGKFKQKEGDTMWYYHHAVLGVGVRGQPHLWWVLDMGLTRFAERGRVPPEDKALWKRVMDIIFEKDDNFIQMSDSAAASLQDHFGVLQRFSVNHLEKEWAKHVRPIWNVETGEKRAGLCSTNYADSQWQKMKDAIPNGLKSSTGGSRRTKMLYVRAWQWKVIVQQEDRWDAFCAACKRWREHQRCTPPEDAPADAGHFGFDETGEAALLRKEEGLRKKWRAERSKGVPVADVPQVSLNDWTGEDSDATDSGDSDCTKEGEEAVNDSSSNAPEAQQVSSSGEKADDDLQFLSRTQYGDRYFEPQLAL